MKKIDNIDMVISSGSRPEFLKRTLESFSERFKFSGKIRYIFHEDVLLPEKTEEVLDIIKPYNFAIVQVDNPPLGQPLALNASMQHIKSDYFFNLEDDWVCDRDLPIDHVLALMEKHRDINQVCFNKRSTMTEKYGWKKVEIERDGQCFVTNVHWTLIPSLWRTSFMKKYWKTPPKHCIIQWWWNKEVKQLAQDVDGVRYASWMMENVGAYFLGKYGEPPYVRHIGVNTTRSNGPNNIFEKG